MTVIVTEAAKASALVSLEAAKAYLGIFDDVRDPAVKAVIAQASARCVSYLGRPLALQGYRERVSIRDKSGVARLSRGPIVGITSISVNGRPLTTLDEMSINRDRARIYLDRSFLIHERCLPEQVVDVTYRAGFLLDGITAPASDTGDMVPILTPNLPDDVAAGCLATILMIYQGQSRDPLLKSESIANVGSASWQVPDGSLGGLTGDATSALDALYLSCDWMA